MRWRRTLNGFGDDVDRPAYQAYQPSERGVRGTSFDHCRRASGELEAALVALEEEWGGPEAVRERVVTQRVDEVPIAEFCFTRVGIR